MKTENLARAIWRIRTAARVIAFTGAGISVESGIPPFRGENGLWSRYDPIILDLDYFQRQPEKSWQVIKEIFYDFFGQARPNPAHYALAEMEARGWLQGIITQNIDNLHQEAGSHDVVEFHGTSRQLTCLGCGAHFPFQPPMLQKLPPRCPSCGGLLKPDFIFFGENIPPAAYQRALEETRIADVWLVIGTTGEIMPASLLPVEASRNSATIIEVNIQASQYTHRITDIFLQDKASQALSQLVAGLKDPPPDEYSEWYLHNR